MSFVHIVSIPDVGTVPELRDATVSAINRLVVHLNNDKSGSGTAAAPAIASRPADTITLAQLQSAITAAAARSESNVQKLFADFIHAGTLSVGGGGVAGQFEVLDHAGDSVGWIGDDTQNSGYDGAWFRQIWAGGTGPANAPFAVNTDGALSINFDSGNAGAIPFQLDLNGVVTTIANSTDTYTLGGVGLSSVTGLKVLNSTNTNNAVIWPGIVGVAQGTDFVSAMGINSITGAGFLQTYDAAGAQMNRVSYTASGSCGLIECFDNSANYAYLIGTGDANVSHAYLLASATVVNSAGQFVGAGVNVGTNGIAGGGFNPFISATQYFGDNTTVTPVTSVTISTSTIHYVDTVTGTQTLVVVTNVGGTTHSWPVRGGVITTV